MIFKNRYKAKKVRIIEDGEVVSDYVELNQYSPNGEEHRAVMEIKVADLEDLLRLLTDAKKRPPPKDDLS